MKELKDRYAPPFRLLVIGDGKERAHLTRAIRDNNLTSEVSLVGSVPSHNIPDYLALGYLFVFASTSETQGMVVLEAMAAGLPVVAVNASGVDAFVQTRRTGVLTEENIETWTDAIHALLINRSERRVMARAAAEEARQHSVEKFSADVAKIYQTALGARSSFKKNASTRVS
jgi:glycosyltransferase involved in cell wall biosynthesis